MATRLLVTLCLAIGLVFAAGVPCATAQEDECFQMGGMWDAAAGRCVISATIEVTIRYPLEFAGYEFATQAIDQFLSAQRAAFLDPLVEYGFFTSPGPLTLEIDYEIVGFSPSIASLLFTIYDYTGGAHGNTAFQTFVFDLDAGRAIGLDDLFVTGSAPLDVIAPVAQQSLADQLGEMADPGWIQEGTGTNPENYQNFVLTPEALVFYFPPYQVAAYAAGPQTVSIPLAQLAALLAPPFRGGQ